jgi:hypothetical protein
MVNKKWQLVVTNKDIPLFDELHWDQSHPLLGMKCMLCNFRYFEQ